MVAGQSRASATAAVAAAAATGEGAKAWCPFMSVEQVSEQSLEDVCKKVMRLTGYTHIVFHLGRANACKPVTQRSGELLQQLLYAPQLCVAFIIGPIGGLELTLALACDFRFGSADCRLVKNTTNSPFECSWWLASLAFHIGAHRAQTWLNGKAELNHSSMLDSGLLSGEVPIDCLMDEGSCTTWCTSALRLPSERVPLPLMRRMMLQGFSLEGNDSIGHTLAATSLLLKDSAPFIDVSRPWPLPRMLQPQLEVSSDVCELRLPADLESFSLDSLADCFRSMGEQLHMLSASGAPLPPCAMLVMQTAAAAAAAASEGKDEAAATPTDTEAAVKDDAEVAAAESQAAEAATAATVALEVPPLPLELLAAMRTPSANLQQLGCRWFIKWEKLLASVATLPLRTVCVFVGGGVCGPAALQLGLACDVRVATLHARLQCARGHVCPGSLSFKLARHVGLSHATSLLMLQRVVSARHAKAIGLVQGVCEDEGAELRRAVCDSLRIESIGVGRSEDVEGSSASAGLGVPAVSLVRDVLAVSTEDPAAKIRVIGVGNIEESRGPQAATSKLSSSRANQTENRVSLDTLGSTECSEAAQSSQAIHSAQTVQTAKTARGDRTAEDEARLGHRQARLPPPAALPPAPPRGPRRAVAQGASLLLARAMLEAAWHRTDAETQERLDQWEAVQPTCRGAAGSEGGGGHGTTRIAGAESGGCSGSSGNGDGDGGNGSGSSSGGGGGGGARGSAASAISVRARQLEHLSFFFADQFIMPSDDLEWRLAFGSETAAGSQSELQATTGGVGADNAESDCCVSRDRGGCGDVDPGGASGDGVDSAFVAVCNGVDAGNGAARAEVSVAAATLRCVREDDVLVLRFEGQVLDSTVVDTLLSEITSSNASPTLHALVFILGPSPLHAPRDENGIRAWRACISALEDSALPTVTLIHGDVSAAALDLALACESRFGGIDASFVLAPGLASPLPASSVPAQSAWLRSSRQLTSAASSSSSAPPISVDPASQLSPSQRAHLRCVPSSARVFHLARSLSAGAISHALLFRGRLDYQELRDSGLLQQLPFQFTYDDGCLRRVCEHLRSTPASTSNLRTATMAMEPAADHTQPNVRGNASTQRRKLMNRLPQVELAQGLQMTRDYSRSYDPACGEASFTATTPFSASSAASASNSLFDNPSSFPASFAAPRAPPTLRLSLDGATAIITIDRPARANAYDGAMLNQLEGLVRTLQDQEVAAVIFHSSNPRFFCAGADADRISNPTAKDALQMQSQRVFSQIADAPFLSIAVVEGAAVGGGFEWALACDCRILGSGARMWLPEVTFGLIPSAGGCTRLSRLVGAARAKQLVLFQERLECDRAIAWGVARECVADPLGRARALAAALAAADAAAPHARTARALAKQAIDGGGGGGGAAQLAFERVSEGLLYEAKHVRRAQLLGVGVADTGRKYTQTQVADLLGITQPRLRALFGNAHIGTRCLADIENEQDAQVTQGYLLEKHLRWATRMAMTAVPVACAAARVPPADIAYMCVCTSTGYLSPGLSAHVAQALRLSPFVQRADIVGMGCHAGLNALAAAAHWAEANLGKAALVLCVEVVSAAYVWDRSRPDIAVALTNSLFGDGCAAAVLRCDVKPSPNLGLPKANGHLDSDTSTPASTPTPTPSPTPSPTPTPTPTPTLLGFESMLLPDTLDVLRYRWDESCHKFSFTISAEVPYTMGHAIPTAVDRLLTRFKLRTPDIAHWCVHSGGKKVLDSVIYSLGLSRHDVRHTLASLHSHGNMSSASFLWTYHSLVQKEGHTCLPGQHGVFITMGPGAGIECALFRF